MKSHDEGTLIVPAPAANYRGTVDAQGSAVFAGIPFAEPPLGRLRFRPPAPRRDTSLTVDATRFRPGPAQAGSALATGHVESEGQPFGPPGMQTSEDCLYLNVWTPAVEGSLPVIVWIYGGGFDAGSAAPPYTHGAALSRLTGTVVVSVNYRVGALGFGYWRGIGGEEWAGSSNLGLQDQLAGLAWVRRNIGAFGGDPGNITVAGESAGAFCIGSLLAIPAACRQFDRAIMHSGSAGRIFPIDTADSIARDLVERVGVEKDRADFTGVETMAELQRVDVGAILAAQSQVVDADIGLRNLAGGRSWGVVLDGELLTELPLDALRRGAASDIPILIGANRDETQPFRTMLGAAWPPSDDAALREEIARAGVADAQAVLEAYRADAPAGSADLGGIRSLFLSDAIYRRPACETALAHRNGGGHAWTFLFSATPLGPSLGAGHGVDLIYTFDTLADAGVLTEDNRAIQEDFLGAWAAFARGDAPDWPEYAGDAVGMDEAATDQAATHQAATTRQFGGDERLVSEPAFPSVRQVWPMDSAQRLPAPPAQEA